MTIMPSVALCAASFLNAVRTADSVRLLGWTTVAADAQDLSGLTDVLPGNIPHNRLGGFGSGIASTSKRDRYLLLPDRGPANGAVAYQCRWHEAEIKVTPGATPAVSFKLLSTTLMTAPESTLQGLSSLWNEDPSKSLRFDPEGVRELPGGDVLVSDEYGPVICVFERATGRRNRVLDVPDIFQVTHPATEGKAETAGNTSGRVTNHGFEGLALSPDGKRAYAMIQGSLIQDGGKEGTNLRIQEFDVGTGKAGKQYLFHAADPTHAVSEILAIDDHRFLVLERDGIAGPDSRHKKIVLIDIQGASDISQRASLPAKEVPEGVRPVHRRDLINLLDPALSIDISTLPEKIEGLAFAPDLPTGERCLLITSDNDFRSDQHSFIWAFAIPSRQLAGDR